MGKLEYLDALKRAMLGLPPEIQARTLAYYEQRFVDAAGNGRSEQDLALELDDPKQIAMTLRASSHLSALSANPAANPPASQIGKQTGNFSEKKDPADFLRLTVSAVGLAIFNLFMLVPALVYSSLLLSVYLCALAFYLGGVATTASGLAGANELLLDWPARFVTIDPDSRGERQTRITIGPGDIQVTQERPADSANHAGPDEPDGEHTERGERREHSRVLRGAEAVADSKLRISTEMDAESRTTQTLVGFGMVLGGIALFLLSLVLTRYTLVGLKRYFQMNRSLLRGH
jgi:uncharacterized membrane protein